MSKNRTYHTVLNTFIFLLLVTQLFCMITHSIKPQNKVNIYGQLSDRVKLLYCDNDIGSTTFGQWLVHSVLNGVIGTGSM